MSEREEKPAEILEQLDRLLQEQHDLLLQNDLSAVEEKGGQILNIAAEVSAAGKRLPAQHMEKIRQLHEQMILILTARKEHVATELAATRHKRSLNKSYGVRNE